MRRIGLAALVVCILQCAPVKADFINGGFEAGTFNGWTQNGGSYTNHPIYAADGSNRNAILSGAGGDPTLISLGVNNGPSNVFSGQYSARVEDIANGFHWSSISQTATWNDPSINFAYRVVLQDPGHPASQNPGFRIVLHDDTDNVDLYNVFVTSNALLTDPDTSALAYVLPTSSLGRVVYTDWIIQSLDTSAIQGHQLTLSLSGYDCGQGAHGGYVVLDGFGAVIPTAVPEPVTMAVFGFGALVAGGVYRRNRKGIAA